VALFSCTNLKTVSLPVPRPDFVSLLTQIAQFSALEAIEIRKKAKTKIKLPASINPKLKSLLRFVEPPCVWHRCISQIQASDVPSQE